MKKQRTKSGDISRREFVKISGTASIAVLAYPVSSLKADEITKSEHVVFQNDTLPVINKCDVIVVGGSFSGVSAALNFAKKGKKVVLVEKRIYLGREITSTYRPWIDLVAGSALPELVQSCVEKNIGQPFSSTGSIRCY